MAVPASELSEYIENPETSIEYLSKDAVLLDVFMH